MLNINHGESPLSLGKSNKYRLYVTDEDHSSISEEEILYVLYVLLIVHYNDIFTSDLFFVALKSTRAGMRKDQSDQRARAKQWWENKGFDKGSQY